MDYSKYDDEVMELCDKRKEIILRRPKDNLKKHQEFYSYGIPLTQSGKLFVAKVVKEHKHLR